MTWSPDLHRGDARADLAHDPGALVAEDAGELALRIEARQRVGVGVADAGGLDLHQHLARLRPREFDFLDRERLVRLPGHRRARLHAVPPRMFRAVAAHRAQIRAASSDAQGGDRLDAAPAGRAYGNGMDERRSHSSSAYAAAAPRRRQWRRPAATGARHVAAPRRAEPPLRRPGDRRVADDRLGIVLLPAGDPGRADGARSRPRAALGVRRLFRGARRIGAARARRRARDRPARRPAGAGRVEPRARARPLPARRRRGDRGRWPQRGWCSARASRSASTTPPSPPSPACTGARRAHRSPASP